MAELPAGWDIVWCDRCGDPCMFTGDPGAEARLMRRSPVAKGLCVNCSATAFLKAMVGPTIDRKAAEAAERGDEHPLLNPKAQESFAAVMLAGKADADPFELDWQSVVDRWDLPFPKVKRS